MLAWGVCVHVHECVLFLRKGVLGCPLYPTYLPAAPSLVCQENSQ